MTDSTSKSPSQSDELEFFDNIDDFQLEPSQAAATRQPVEDEIPSIDDFVIDRSAAAPRGPKAPADAWYLQVLGHEMGPFPFRELVEMVMAGKVGPKDLIRSGSQSAWIAAGEIDGLIPKSTTTEDDDFELGSGVRVSSDQPEQPANPSGIQVVGGQINRVLTESEKNRQRRAEQQLEAAAPSEAAPDEAPVPTKEEREAARREEIADRLNAWLDDRVQPAADESLDDESDVDDTQLARGMTPAAGYTIPPTTASTYGTPTPAGGVAPPRPMPRKKPKSSGESIFSRIGGMFGSVSAPEVSVKPQHMIALGAIVLVAAIMYLPSMVGGTDDEAIYIRFKEIYSQIQQFRSSNPSAMTAMQQQVVPEVEEKVQDLLDAGAGAAKPIKQQLMWIGRNCLIPMIKNPSAEPTELDERIKSHFEAIDGLKQ
ncbi:DUF4339 domain-containing protein [Rubinisphaera margarita]|uniref:DUF4339 domain-containing protein n=1 Tax=Rubinisphaera margarita TaxID=2909586 RepID=UPI001EE996BC|nr:DUF4339 domain-containing protein [Rubinisphaera margarita]MCG6155582.1 DUF4339 domain-containing protein [Rubinisphaera margarita]